MLKGPEIFPIPASTLGLYYARYCELCGVDDPRPDEEYISERDRRDLRTAFNEGLCIELVEFLDPEVGSHCRQLDGRAREAALNDFAARVLSSLRCLDFREKRFQHTRFLDQADIGGLRKPKTADKLFIKGSRRTVDEIELVKNSMMEVMRCKPDLHESEIVENAYELVKNLLERDIDFERFRKTWYEAAKVGGRTKDVLRSEMSKAKEK